MNNAVAITRKLDCFTDLSSAKGKKAVTIFPLVQASFAKWLFSQSEQIKNWVKINDFCAKPNSFCLIPDAKGNLFQVLLGLESANMVEAFGVLPDHLPAGSYQLAESILATAQEEQAAISWGLGSYHYTRYRKTTVGAKSGQKARLVFPKKCDKNTINSIVSSIFWVRDLINTPAEDMHPEVLAAAAIHLAKETGAKVKQIVGDQLLVQNFPAIHAVGRASINPPRLIELNWGKKDAPKIVLVGKGVCFDSGGLNLKPADSMLGMKGDMAGAAHALGLARLLMLAKLPINLKVLIPAVENVISGASYKPGDVINTREGKTVEIYNTDAEGRLILADALTLACENKPKLVIDFASLTGAAIVALGSKVAALFTESEQTANEIEKFTAEENEAAWRLPLFVPYREFLRSSIADLVNGTSSKEAGSIKAALFLREFVTAAVTWVHLDLHGINHKTYPAHPEGGDARCLRGLFKYFKNKYL